MGSFDETEIKVRYDLDIGSLRPESLFGMGVSVGPELAVTPGASHQTLTHASLPLQPCTPAPLESVGAGGR